MNALICLLACIPACDVSVFLCTNVAGIEVCDLFVVICPWMLFL